MDKPESCSEDAPNTIQRMQVLERGGFLEQLDGLLAEAALGRGRLVLVRGEAGIGKTTLVEAFVSGRSKRVLWGACDPLFPPRALAPVLDIASQVGGELTEALEDPNRHRIILAFLNMVRSGDRPRIVVLEDVQWADEATLELLQVIGRRSTQLPAVIIATVRDDEVDADHPLTLALGTIPATSRVTVDLPPLSESAVKELAGGTAIDPGSLFRTTGGNPFFVTEILASGNAKVPATVREAILSRAASLGPESVNALRAATVLSQRVEVEILSAVADVPRSAVAACVDRGLLLRDESKVGFRHELARQAFAESLPSELQSQLHSRALNVLREPALGIPSDELARHAFECGDSSSVLAFAPLAAQQAARFGAHKAAVANYRMALHHATSLSRPDRAALLCSYAHECYLTGEGQEAVDSQQEAVQLWAEEARVVEQAAATAELAEYLLWNRQSDAALQAPDRALDLLRDLPPAKEIAQAHAKLAQVLLISGDYSRSQSRAREAVALAEQLGEEAIAVHALNTLGSAAICLNDPDGWGYLEASLSRAEAGEFEQDVSRAFNNILASSHECRLYDIFDRYSARAKTFFRERELDASEMCLMGDIVGVQVERGRWSQAEDEARAVIERGTVHGRAQSLMYLGLLLARRGTEDPWPWLDEAYAEQARFHATVAFEMAPIRAEAAWLEGDDDRAIKELGAGIQASADEASPWAVGAVAFWATLLGIDYEGAPRPAEPYAYFLDGYLDKAAGFWKQLGCPYEEALVLSCSEEEHHLREGLAIFRALGASPAANKVVERLKAMGAKRISRGPRRTTVANPAGLSPRELEVLAFLAGGLRNAEIAERMVVSRRTIDHHVSAILTKLGSRDRYQAGRLAVGLGIEPRS